ncbi:hypothetical protein pdam_00010051, partial [Pocillopora damicornis]
MVTYIKGVGYCLCDPEIPSVQQVYVEDNSIFFCTGNLSTVAIKTFKSLSEIKNSGNRKCSCLEPGRSHKTFIPITSIGITVSKYLKQGRPQSDNKTADQQQRGPVGEQKLLVRVKNENRVFQRLVRKKRKKHRMLLSVLVLWSGLKRSWFLKPKEERSYLYECRQIDFVKDVDNVLKTALEVELPAERARCHNATDLTTDADEIANRQVASQ